MRSSTAVLGLVVLGLLGCEGDEPPMDEEEESLCVRETRDEPFRLGLAREGISARITFTDADPAAPVRGTNAWTVAVSDLGGAAIQGASLSVRAWMPDHGHGSPQPVVIEELGAGEYVLDPVNLFMAALWEITIAVESGATTDEVMFPFCVE